MTGRIDNIELIQYIRAINQASFSKKTIEHKNQGFLFKAILEIKDINFCNINFVDYNFKNCKFTGCIFNDIDFINTNFEECIFENCTFENIKISKTDSRNITFNNCQFKNNNEWSSTLESQNNFNIIEFVDNDIDDLTLNNVSISIFKINNVVKKSAKLIMKNSYLHDVSIINCCLEDSDISSNYIRNLNCNNSNLNKFQNNKIDDVKISNSNLGEEVKENRIGNESIGNSVINLEKTILNENVIHNKVPENNNFNNVVVKTPEKTKEEKEILNNQKSFIRKLTDQYKNLSLDKIKNKALDYLKYFKNVILLTLGISILIFGFAALSFKTFFLSAVISYVFFEEIKPRIEPYLKQAYSYVYPAQTQASTQPQEVISQTAEVKQPDNVKKNTKENSERNR